MKFLKFPVISSALACMALMAACDNIPEDERFIDNPRPTVSRKIVIYEFTGQRCKNCPEGAQTVHDLQAAFPGKVLAVNLHPEKTQYTIPLGKLDLTSPYATFLYKHYNPTAFPAACVNGGSAMLNVNLWTSTSTAALEEPSPATVSLDVNYDPATRTASVDYDVVFNDFTTEEMLLQIYVVENGIVGPQNVNGKNVMDYVHNHVLRTAMFEDWGHSIGTEFAVSESVKGSASVQLNDKWVAENCEIIACLLKAGDKIVVQGEDAPLCPADDNTSDNQ